MYTLKELEETWNQELTEAEQLLSALPTLPGTDQDFLQAYNKLSILFDHLSGSCELMMSVHPEAAVREEAETVESKTKQLIVTMSQSVALFERFDAIDTQGLAADEQRLVSHTLRDFRRAGIDKDQATKDQISALKAKITALGQTFGKHIREDKSHIFVTSEDLVGFPEDFVASHVPDSDGKIKITTDYTDIGPFMKFCANADARKRMQHAHLNRAYPENTAVLKDLITARHELATILGYKHWAAYVTETKMIGSAEAVETFITQLADAAREPGQEDMARLLLAKQQDDTEATAVYGYDSAYYSEKIRQADYDLDAKEVRQYFPYDRVKQGLLSVTAELFGLQYEPLEEDLWHDQVDTYMVKDAVSGDALGKIHLDMHPREDKYSHAAQFTVRSGVKGVQLPVGTLVCNFPNPRESDHALMEHGDVVTFFHEFGHLVHHILGGQQQYLEFSGVATEWDFVEAPSQFLEEWAWNADVLARFAVHYDSGATISPALVAKMRAANEFGNGTFVMQQVYYTAMSYHFYSTSPDQLDLEEKETDLRQQYSLFAPVPDLHMHANFGHLDGYSAIYYTYMWSLVIAKDLFTRFDSATLMDPVLAGEYRDNILAMGGSKDARELVEDFLGREYNIHAFRQWLTSTS